MPKTFHIVIAVLFHLAITTVVNAQMESCPGDWRNRAAPPHGTLLKYATYANVAYYGPGHHRISFQGYCREEDSASRGSDERITVRNIPDKYINEARESLQSRNEGVEIKVYRYKELGKRYFVCDRGESLGFRLAANLSYVVSNDELPFFIDALIISSSFMGPQKIEGAVQLEREDGSGELIVGIPGTKIDRLAQWNSSIQQLLRGSCTFDFVADVAEKFFSDSCIIDELQTSEHAVVGHSLGGAVAQYVGHSKNLEAIIKRRREDANFGVYSFNSIGMDSTTKNRERHKTIYSVRIAGELFEPLGQRFQTRQIGNVIRYQMSEDSGPRSPGDLHGIAAVREGICECRYPDSTSQFEFSRPYLAQERSCHRVPN